MEPVTINLDGLNSLGPHIYLSVYVLATAFFGLIARRSIRLAGVTKGDISMTHTIKGAVTGCIGIIVFLATLCSGNDMFDRAIRVADHNSAAGHQGYVGMDFYERAVEERDLAKRVYKQTVGERNLARERLTLAEGDREKLIMQMEAELTSKEIERVLSRKVYLPSSTATGENDGTHDN